MVLIIVFLKSLFWPKNLWKALKSFSDCIKVVGLNLLPLKLSAIFTICVALSSNTLKTVNGNSGVFVSGLNLTFLIISLTKSSRSAAVSLIPLSAAYRLNTCLTSLTADNVGL